MSQKQPGGFPIAYRISEDRTTVPVAPSTIERATSPRAATGRLEPQRIRDLLPRREGAFWVLFAMAVPRVFGPMFTIILRRFLGPGTSGAFDLAYTPYTFLDSLRNFGTGPALVFQRSISRETANTAWTLNLLFAVIVTLFAQLLAHPIALYYGHPQIEGIFRVLSIAYVFTSVGSVHFFLLMRDLNFRARSVPAMGQVIAGGTIALLFAVWGFGAGALAARELGSVIAGAILLWAIYPYRPRIQLVPRLAWELYRYGAWIGTGLTILYMSQNVDIFIGGRIIHNTSDVGFYTTSWNLAFIAAGVFTAVSSTMVFPTLTRVRDNLEVLRSKLLTAVRHVGLIMFPASALLAVLAPVIIVPLLGEKWVAYRTSFLVLSLLAVYAGNRTMLAIFFEGYKSIGKPWIMPIYNAIKLAVMIPAMIFGAQHGILGLALAYVPLQVLEFPAALILAHRVLRISPGQVWTAARTPVFAALCLATLVGATEIVLLREAHLDDLLTLGACLLVAGIIYPAMLFLLDRRVFVEARGILLNGF